MSDAPTPQRAASAEERLREQLPNTPSATAVLEEYATLPAHQRALVARMAEIVWPIMDKLDASEAANAALLDRITAAEARAETERGNREQWAAQAHEFAAAADRLAREKDAATADRDRLADEVARLRKALKPFIAHYEPWMDRWDDDAQMSTFARVTFGDLKRLRRALTATGGTTDGTDK